MREILFRGKAKQTIDKSWLYGGVVHQTDYYGEEVDRWFIIDGTDTQDCDIGPEHEIIPETLGQYTGLKDKNGTKIFEGDIIQPEGVFNRYMFAISFGACGGVKNVEHAVGYIGFYLEPANKSSKECRCYGLRDDIVYFVEEGATVIGNIHDNPELLENSQNLS